MDRRVLRARMNELRELLNEWDLLGVRDLFVHDDEYDCLVGPLLAKIVAAPILNSFALISARG